MIKIFLMIILLALAANFINVPPTEEDKANAIEFCILETNIKKTHISPYGLKEVFCLDGTSEFLP